MNRTYWLLLSFVAAAAALSGACSSEFASCETRRKCPAGDQAGAPNAGDGGSAGQAGMEEDGHDGDGAGKGGSAGEGGNAGEGGAADLGPVLFGECSVKREVACVQHASAQRLACDGTRWQAGTTCAAGELCDSANGTCAPPVPECASAEPGAVVCRNDTLLSCGPDLVTASVGKTCDGRCKLGVCLAPTCGDGKVQRGEQCDDGQPSGDGCSATCRAEPVALALGSQTTCALSSTGLVKCWGNNDSGQLGLGNIESTKAPSKLSAIDLGTGRTAVAISVAGANACALLDHGDVKCWGANLAGQLGTNDSANRGDGPGEMGDALVPIPLGAGSKAIGVSAGGTHTCVVLDGGSVKCWGSGSYGQLGQGNAADVLSPKDLPAIKLARPATAVSASGYLFAGKGGDYGASTCALLDQGTVQCWGYAFGVPHTGSANIDSSNGIGDYPNEMSGLSILTFSGGSPARSIFAGAVSAAILNDGSLRLWGSGWQLGQPALGSGPIGMSPEELQGLSAVQMGSKTVKSIAVSKHHACAILDAGELKCWGDGSSGQLGLGSIASTNAAPSEIPSVNLGGKAALQVAVSDSHTCAIVDDGTLRCWGYNGSGQLGLGHTDNKRSADTTVDLTF
jgi:cysteine-rich repeat protein